MIKSFMTYWRLRKLYKRYIVLLRSVPATYKLLPVSLVKPDLPEFFLRFDKMLDDVMSLYELLDEFRQLYETATGDWKNKVSDDIVDMNNVLEHFAVMLNEYMSIRDKLLAGPCKITLFIEAISDEVPKDVDIGCEA